MIVYHFNLNNYKIFIKKVLYFYKSSFKVIPCSQINVKRKRNMKTFLEAVIGFIVVFGPALTIWFFYFKV
jgi:hypothetical protein